MSEKEDSEKLEKEIEAFFKNTDDLEKRAILRLREWKDIYKEMSEKVTLRDKLSVEISGLRQKLTDKANHIFTLIK